MTNNEIATTNRGRNRRLTFIVIAVGILIILPSLFPSLSVGPPSIPEIPSGAILVPIPADRLTVGTDIMALGDWIELFVAWPIENDEKKSQNHTFQNVFVYRFLSENGAIVDGNAETIETIVLAIQNSKDLTLLRSAISAGEKATFSIKVLEIVHSPEPTQLALQVVSIPISKLTTGQSKIFVGSLIQIGEISRDSISESTPEPFASNLIVIGQSGPLSSLEIDVLVPIEAVQEFSAQIEMSKQLYYEVQVSEVTEKGDPPKNINVNDLLRTPSFQTTLLRVEVSKIAPSVDAITNSSSIPLTVRVVVVDKGLNEQIESSQTCGRILGFTDKNNVRETYTEDLTSHVLIEIPSVRLFSLLSIMDGAERVWILPEDDCNVSEEAQ